MGRAPAYSRTAICDPIPGAVLKRFFKAARASRVTSLDKFVSGSFLNVLAKSSAGTARRSRSTSRASLASSRRWSRSPKRCRLLCSLETMSAAGGALYQRAPLPARGLFGRVGETEANCGAIQEPLTA